MVPAMLPGSAASNVVRLAPPAHPVRMDRSRESGSIESQLVATVALAWQLHFALAWSYPRLCYAVWAGLMTLPAPPARDR